MSMLSTAAAAVLDEADGRVSDPLLERIIREEQVDVLFQPLIAPLDGCVVGAEALARSPVEPDTGDLFARAARAGLAEQLSRLVQRKAFATAARWKGPLRDLALSVNLLPAEVARDDFDNLFLTALDHAHIDPRRIIVEITENALLVGHDQAAERLGALRSRGVRVAIDDFGTGYSSLAYLTTLPLDLIKIDRGLVSEIVGRNRDRIVVKALINLARELDLKIVVEGVENCAQLALLAEWGCDFYQGFHGAGALTEAELSRFVAATQFRNVA